MFREPLSFEGHRLIKVTIEQLNAAQDSYGAPAVTWNTFAAAVPAAIEDIAGDEHYADKQVERISRYEVLIRYRKGVTEKMRLNLVNDTAAILMDIEEVNNWKMQNQWMLLKCKAGVDRG